MLDRKHLCVGAVPSSPACNHVTGFHRCPEHPEVVHVYTDGCHTSSCDLCWPTWASRTVRQLAIRMGAYNASNQMVLTRKAPRHVVLSPPPGMFSTNQWLSLEKQVEVMQSFKKAVGVVQGFMGLKGAVAVDHPYRLKHVEHAQEDHTASSRTNRYRDILESGEPLVESLKLSPHRHLLVVGPLPDSRAFFEVTGGWVIHIIPYRKSEQSWAQRFAIQLRYLLSHSYQYGAEHVVHLYGCLLRGIAPYKQEKLAPVQRTCDVCGGPVMHYDEWDKEQGVSCYRPVVYYFPGYRGNPFARCDDGVLTFFGIQMVLCAYDDVFPQVAVIN